MIGFFLCVNVITLHLSRLTLKPFDLHHMRNLLIELCSTLTSSRHFTIVPIFLSSAKFSEKTLRMSGSESLKNIKNKSGHRMVPWPTPDLTSIEQDFSESIRTYRDLLCKYDLNHTRSLFDTGNLAILRINRSGLTVSNALLMSA